MDDEKKYLNDVKKEFQNLGKQEKAYLKNLEKQLTSFSNECKEQSYDAYVDNFGRPEEIVASFYESMEYTDLKKKFTYKKFIIGMFVSIMIVALLAVAYIYVEYRKGLNQNIDQIEVTIQEE